MNWLKKNLFLALGGVVALGLLGFAIFFLLTRKQVVDEVTEQLNTRTQELKDLVSRDPHPNQENIEAARKEQKKLAAFLQESRKFFVPVAGFTNIDSAAFKDLLQTTISELEHGAEKAGVTLPAKYDFTFTPQRKSVDFAADTLVPLATQVAEIKAICDVLFDARVHTLTSLRRAPVAKEDQGATDYLIGRKPETNAVTGAVLVPYEIQFQGFTAELAAVLEGFFRSSNSFIVKNIDVQTNAVTAAEGRRLRKKDLDMGARRDETHHCLPARNAAPALPAPRAFKRSSGLRAHHYAFVYPSHGNRLVECLLRHREPMIDRVGCRRVVEEAVHRQQSGRALSSHRRSDRESVSFERPGRKLTHHERTLRGISGEEVRIRPSRRHAVETTHGHRTADIERLPGPLPCAAEGTRIECGDLRRRCGDEKVSQLAAEEFDCLRPNTRHGAFLSLRLNLVRIDHAVGLQPAADFDDRSDDDRPFLDVDDRLCGDVDELAADVPDADEAARSPRQRIDRTEKFERGFRCA